MFHCDLLGVRDYASLWAAFDVFSRTVGGFPWLVRHVFPSDYSWSTMITYVRVTPRRLDLFISALLIGFLSANELTRSSMRTIIGSQCHLL